MLSRLGNKLSKKTDAKIFEQMVKDCAIKKYGENFELYGRNGQEQHGIDIYSPTNFDRVIQCKNYNTNDIPALKKAIKRDYDNAVDYFYQEKSLHFTSFVIATSVDIDTKLQDSIMEMNKTYRITIEILFWEHIEEIIFENTDLLKKYYSEFIISADELKLVFTANELYAKSFTETLFLHKDQNNSKVNLSNLFVMPKYTEGQKNTPQTNLEQRFANFLKEDKNFLFIEGDAGCGKSTFVSWFNYHVWNDDNTAKQIFNGRPVITIRLRDLDRKIISSEKKLIDAILKYMNLSTLDDLEKRFPNALMILDGFDELCIIENITNYNELIEDLEEIDLMGYQYIITSRPQYINKNINVPCDFITLQHFDKEKREEWIKHYTSPDYCNQILNDEIQEYIINIDRNTESVICDTPMMLYMLAAKNTSIELTKNSWTLYHHIFYNELSETEYNKMFRNAQRTYKHNIHKYQDILYKITENIAYTMYCTGNNQFYVSSNELRKIIENLSNHERKLKNENVKDMVEQCYALCNYWKEISKGIVEFYHNNIRDFFLCEKIYRELNAVYSQRDISRTEMVQRLIKILMQFKKAHLEDMVCRFILLRAENEIDNPDSFVYKEKQQRLLPNLFEEMLTNGELYDNLKEKNHIHAIVNILSCTAQIYRHIYEPILSENEYIKWWNNAQNINNSKMIQYCFKTIFSHRFMEKDSYSISSKGEYSYINFGLCELMYIDFRNANLIGAHLTGTNLTGAHLSGANLTQSNLNNADLYRANLTGATLIEATLPDGSASMEQEKQVQKLKSMNIGIIFGDEQSMILKLLKRPLI